jgi:hypothetical protein
MQSACKDVANSGAKRPAVTWHLALALTCGEFSMEFARTFRSEPCERQTARKECAENAATRSAVSVAKLHFAVCKSLILQSTVRARTHRRSIQFCNIKAIRNLSRATRANLCEITSSVGLVRGVDDIEGIAPCPSVGPICERFALATDPFSFWSWTRPWPFGVLHLQEGHLLTLGGSFFAGSS